MKRLLKLTRDRLGRAVSLREISLEAPLEEIALTAPLAETVAAAAAAHESASACSEKRLSLGGLSSPRRASLSRTWSTTGFHGFTLDRQASASSLSVLEEGCADSSSGACTPRTRAAAAELQQQQWGSSSVATRSLQRRASASSMDCSAADGSSDAAVVAAVPAVAVAAAVPAAAAGSSKCSSTPPAASSTTAAAAMSLGASGGKLQLAGVDPFTRPAERRSLVHSVVDKAAKAAAAAAATAAAAVANSANSSSSGVLSAAAAQQQQQQPRRDSVGALSDSDSASEGCSGGSGGSGSNSLRGDECARAQVVMGNKRKWLLSQLCKSVDLMKRDLLVVTLAAHDAPLADAVWDNAVGTAAQLNPETCYDPDPLHSRALVDSRYAMNTLCIHY
jgi:hypothetical protein